MQNFFDKYIQVTFTEAGYKIFYSVGQYIYSISRKWVQRN
jgi:hypothetical protein